MSVTPAPDTSAPGQAPAGAQSGFVKTFPCAGCGARLTFAPGTHMLKCEHCGFTNEIAENDARIEELDFDPYLKALEGKQETYEEEHVRCEKCGAEQNLGENLFASKCSFCGANIVSKSYAHRRIQPKAMIPFAIDRRAAQEDFRKWVRGLWLAPGELKKYAESDAGVTGTYIPFWTYDCRTSTDYTGERGEDYYTNEERTVTNSRGENVTETVRVKNTNWNPVSGHVDYFHDDILVLASNTFPRTLRGAMAKWDLKKLVPYQAEYISGYRAEAYQIGLREGYPLAKEQIDSTIYGLVRRDIGGDQQRVHDLSTRYSEIKFKHILAPVWVSAYRFRNKTYRFLVNGQTGEVAGESPLSWQRVTFLVITIIVVIIFALILSSGHR